MSVRYFPKPQPLSPKTKTWLEGDVRYRTLKGKKVVVSGVATTDSFYYLWFEYLKRSEKYKTACANNGKGMKRLYADFGDVFAYEGADGFWDWWRDRGQYLFGIEPLNQLETFATVGDVNGIAKQVEDGTFKLVAIPTNLTKSTIKRRLNKLLTELEVTPTAEQTAKYSVAQSKVDVESLRSCLMAHDLKQQGLEVLEIGLQVKWVSTAEAKDLIEDGRSRGREYDVAELESHSAKAAKKYWKVHDTVVKRLEEKAQKENAIFDRAAENDKHGRKGGLATIGRQRIDYMSDEYIREAMLKEGYVKTFGQRTRRKQSIRTNTHKLLNKAQANIEAVEKGTFGVGH
jgi:hypothetical protein